ncbi:MAG: phosphoribosyltransferase family protein [Patescibacteria group bacterium]
MKTGRLKNFLLELIFPEECLACRRAGGLLCPICLAQLKFNTEERGATLEKNKLREIFIAGDYQDELLAELIKKYKYHFLSRLGEILAQFLTRFWLNENTEKIYPLLKTLKTSPAEKIILIPIPLTKRRERWRGFNQAEILARALSTKLGYGLNLNLQRIKDRPAQATLDEKTRRANWSGVFYYEKTKTPIISLNDKIIILIDDITTTGATLNAAAAALQVAGATEIYGLVLAKG